MRSLAVLACIGLALSGCAGPDIPAQDATGRETVIRDNSPDLLAIVVVGACFAGITAAGVLLMNPGAIGAYGLCTGN
jgi:hypothetical protein